LAELGAVTVLCARERKALESTAAAIVRSGGKAEVAECDVTDLQSVERLARTVESHWQRLDVLVNNAGVGSFNTALHNMAPQDWDKVLNTNLRGVYYCIRTLAPLMIKAKAGHIVNISSLAGKNALPNGAAYAASKWGLNGLSYSVAEELRAHGIRVSVVCPGSTNTDLSPHVGKSVEKMLQPDDIAHVVKMLVTQEQRSFASEVLIRPTAKP
jgi:NAD(P)-dependent dehydrogenase (short-subunit alcohol dehydrogenase family)